MNRGLLLGLLRTRRWLYPAIAAAFVLFSSAVAGATDTLSTSATDTPTSTATVGASGPPASMDGTTATSSASNGPAGGGGGKNIVHVVNQVDNRLEADGHVQLNVIPGPNVEPVNLASAYSSCQDCQSLAVALQIDVISKTATDVRPENAAVAINYQCTRCDTIAVAFQYVFSVDDPTQVPDEVHKLIADMKQELARLHGEQGITLAEAEQQVEAVIAQFQDLASSLSTKRDEATDPTSPNAPPIPTDTPEPTSTATTVDTATPTDTPQPSATSTPSATPQPTDTATPQPSPTPTP